MLSRDLPLVSIVVPTYNQCEFLDESLTSILNQTYKKIELIVINDGSTDQTKQILQKYTDKAVVVHQENKGQVRSLNLGWSISKGALLSYLSSDDILFPNAVERLVSEFYTNSNVCCVYPNCNYIDKYGYILKNRISRPFDFDQMLIEQVCPIGPGVIFSRSVYEDMGGWNPAYKLNPDREYWIRIHRKGYISFVDEVLASLRMHPGSNSVACLTEAASLEYVNILDEYFNTNHHDDLYRNRAYSFAYLLVARNRFVALDFKRGFYYYRKACDLNGDQSSLGVKFRLVRNVLSKRVMAFYAVLRNFIKIKLF